MKITCPHCLRELLAKTAGVLRCPCGREDFVIEKRHEISCPVIARNLPAIGT